MLDESKKKMIEALIQLESEMSALYALFSAKFPKYAELWSVMASEENEHAERVKALYAGAQEGKVIFNEKQTNNAIVQLFISKIRDVSRKTEANEINLLNALSIALDFEQSIIEKKYYDFFIPRDPEAGRFIKSIEEETTAHAARLRNAWFQEKRNV